MNSNRFFVFFKKDSTEESKTDTQNKQSIDSLDLLLIIYKDFTEIGVGDPYRTQNRKEGDLKKKKRQGWSIWRKGGLDWFGLTLLPTVHQLAEIVLWNGNWAHKKEENSKQKKENATHSWAECIKWTSKQPEQTCDTVVWKCWSAYWFKQITS